MPKRIWLWTGILVAALAAAFIAITVAVPDPQPVVLNPPAEPVQQEPPGPDPQIVSDQLLADLIAFAATRRAPALAAPGYAPWNFVTPSRGAINFNYRLTSVRPPYTAPTDPTVLFPGFEAYRCTTTATGTCFRVTPELTANTCADAELRALIDRGTLVIYTFNNNEVVPIGSLTVNARNCAGL